MCYGLWAMFLMVKCIDLITLLLKVCSASQCCHKLSLTCTYKNYGFSPASFNKWDHVVMHICTHCTHCTSFLLHCTLGNDPYATNPLLCIQRGGVMSHSRGQIKHLILTLGALPHPPPVFLWDLGSCWRAESPFSFTPLASHLVRQMECPEHWCEQNDDTAISIMVLACTCVAIMDFYGVCEKAVKQWAGYRRCWYIPLLRSAKSIRLLRTSNIRVPFKCTV